MTEQEMLKETWDRVYAAAVTGLLSRQGATPRVTEVQKSASEHADAAVEETKKRAALLLEPSPPLLAVVRAHNIAAATGFVPLPSFTPEQSGTAAICENCGISSLLRPRPSPCANTRKSPSVVNGMHAWSAPGVKLVEAGFDAALQRVSEGAGSPAAPAAFVDLNPVEHGAVVPAESSR